MTDIKQRSRPSCLHFKVFFAALGILSGISIFIIFLIKYGNYNAALWGLFSGLFAAIVLHLHILFLRNTIFKTYGIKAFDYMRLTGGVTSLACVISCVSYITLAAVKKQGYQLYGYAYAPAAVFSLLTLKWTGMLLYEGNKYKKNMLQNAEVKNLFSESNTECANEPSHVLSISSSIDLDKSNVNDRK